MKVTKKTLMLAGTAVFLGAGTLTLAPAAFADSADSDTGFVDRIATRFNLNKEEVKSFMDKEHSDRKADRLVKVQERLTQAVSHGKITEAQKAQILAKMSEMQAFRDSLKDKTEDERKAAMDAKKAEIDKWLADNSIAKEYFQMGKGRGHGPRH